MKIKVKYNTGEVVMEVPNHELAALVARLEREKDTALVEQNEAARKLRKLESVAVE